MKRGIIDVATSPPAFAGIIVAVVVVAAKEQAIA
jgi:hypothetical protein